MATTRVTTHWLRAAAPDDPVAAIAPEELQVLVKGFHLGFEAGLHSEVQLVEDDEVDVLAHQLENESGDGNGVNVILSLIGKAHAPLAAFQAL